MLAHARGDEVEDVAQVGGLRVQQALDDAQRRLRSRLERRVEQEHRERERGLHEAVDGHREAQVLRRSQQHVRGPLHGFVQEHAPGNAVRAVHAGRRDVEDECAAHLVVPPNWSPCTVFTRLRSSLVMSSTTSCGRTVGTNICSSDPHSKPSDISVSAAETRRATPLASAGRRQTGRAARGRRLRGSAPPA